MTVKNITDKIKKTQSFISLILAILALVTVIGGYFFWLANLSNEVDSIKNNHLHTLQEDMDNLRKDVYTIRVDVNNISNSVSKIQGYLEK